MAFQNNGRYGRYNIIDVAVKSS